MCSVQENEPTSHLSLTQNSKCWVSDTQKGVIIERKYTEDIYVNAHNLTIVITIYYYEFLAAILSLVEALVV